MWATAEESGCPGMPGGLTFRRQTSQQAGPERDDCPRTQVLGLLLQLTDLSLPVLSPSVN